MRLCSRHHSIHLNARQEAEKKKKHFYGIPDVEVFRRSRAHSVTLEALITSYHLFLASLGRKFQRNKLFQSSKSSVLW